MLIFMWRNDSDYNEYKVEPTMKTVRIRSIKIEHPYRPIANAHNVIPQVHCKLITRVGKNQSTFFVSCPIFKILPPFKRKF